MHYICNCITWSVYVQQLNILPSNTWWITFCGLLNNWTTDLHSFRLDHRKYTTVLIYTKECTLRYDRDLVPQAKGQWHPARSFQSKATIWTCWYAKVLKKDSTASCTVFFLLFLLSLNATFNHMTLQTKCSPANILLSIQLVFTCSHQSIPEVISRLTTRWQSLVSFLSRFMDLL